MTLTLTQARAKAEHNAQYNEHPSRSLATAERRQARDAAERVRETPDDPTGLPPGHQPYNDVSIGLESASGLSAPDPGVAKATEALWLATRKSESSHTGRVTPRNFLGEQTDEVQARTWFSEAPTNQLQFRECTAALLPSEIVRLEIGPTKMDFGQVVVGATARRVLSVVNRLRTHMLVAMHVGAIPELHSSQPMSQVVPPGAVGRFLVCCSPHTIRKFAWTVPYTINGIHEFEFRARCAARSSRISPAPWSLLS